MNPNLKKKNKSKSCFFEGHKFIADQLRPLGIGVATGEMCANRVMFKQMFQAGSFDFCQIDSARIGGVNEILSVYLMAEKFQGKLSQSIKRCV